MGDTSRLRTVKLFVQAQKFWYLNFESHFSANVMISNESHVDFDGYHHSKSYGVASVWMVPCKSQGSFLCCGKDICCNHVAAKIFLFFSSVCHHIGDGCHLALQYLDSVVNSLFPIYPKLIHWRSHSFLTHSSPTQIFLRGHFSNTLRFKCL